MIFIFILGPGSDPTFKNGPWSLESSRSDRIRIRIPDSLEQLFEALYMYFSLVDVLTRAYPMVRTLPISSNLI